MKASVIMPLYQHRFNGSTSLATRWTNTWWSDSSSSLTAVQSAAVGWANDFYGGIAALLPDSTEVVEVVTGEIDQTTGTQLAVAADAISINGTGTGDALPTDVALVVSLRTTLANRRGRGRFYLPQFDSTTALTSDGRVAGTLQTTVLDELLTAWTNYVATGTPVVYSRAGRTTQPIESFDVGDLWDTQRGRQDRILENRPNCTMP